MIKGLIHRQRRQRPQVEELEPRILYSADVMAALLQADALGQGAEVRSLDDYVMPAAAAGVPVAPVSGAATTASEDERVAMPAREIIFIDSRVPDAQKMADALVLRGDAGAVFDMVLLDAGEDGVSQISRALDGRSDLAAIHIISHGSDGAIEIGNTRLDAARLAVDADAVAGWGRALGADGDLLLYGCDVAQSAHGRAFVHELERLTGADVAASTDLTGHALSGGNWALEYTAGRIEAAVVLQQQDTWNHVLAIGVDATSVGTSITNSVTVSHTTSGSNRLMLVGVSLNKGVGNAVSSVNYGGTALTLVGTRSNGDVVVEIWRLVNPALGMNNVTVTMNGVTDGNTVGVMTFTGVDQTTPLGALAGSSGSSGGSGSSTNIISAAGELVFGVIGVDEDTDYNLIPGSGQTETPDGWDLYPGGGINGGGGTKPGAPTVVMSWTWPGSDAWAVAGVSIKPASNVAPVLSGSNNLGAINRNPVTNPGTLVADLIAGRVTDANGDAPLGIAVSAVDNTNGSWQYSVDGGSNWTAFGTPDTATARLLTADQSTYVRFVPTTNWSGTVTNGLSYKAWDLSSGVSGSTANVSASGGSTAFSAATASASIIVSASNTAPTLTGANNLTAINEDPATNPGTLVSDLIAGRTSDIDPSPSTGIAVTAVNNTNGTWQYSLNSGGLWVDFGTPSAAEARLLAANASTYVRFVPNTHWNGTVAGGITFRAWDQTSGVAGSTANTSGTAGNLLDNFGTVSYSNNHGSLNWSSDWVETDGLGGGAADGRFRISGGRLAVQVASAGNNIYRQADLSGALGATLSFSYDNGLKSSATLHVQGSNNGGASYTTLAGGIFNASTNTGVGSASIDITSYIASNTRIRLLVVSGETGAGSNQFSIDNLQIVVTAGNGGSTAFSTATASSAVTINPVNDAPVRTAGSPAAINVNEDSANTTAVTLGLGSQTYGPGGGADEAGQTLTYKVTAIPAYITLWQLDGTTPVALNDTLTLSQLQDLKYKTVADASGSANLSWAVQDNGGVANGGADTLTENLAINVTPINDAPEITTSGSTLVYIENAAPTPVDAGLLVVDVDNTHLTGATVTISANYANGQDVLAFTNQLGITGNWNAATGVLTLSGTATVANYESALRAVTYFNNSDLPSTLVRTVSFVTSDGELSSIAATRTITVAAVNDPPTANAPASYGATEQTLLVLQGTGLSISDLDAASGSMTLTLSVLSGVLNAAAGTTGAGVAGSGTTSLALTGTLAQINNLLAGNGGATLSYFNASDTPSPTDTLTLSVNDNGNSGGPAQTGSAVSTINLTAVNDPPLNTVPGTQIAREGIALVFSAGNLNQISVSDPDAGGAPVRVTLTATLGTITLSTTSNLTFSTGNGIANATMTFTGTLADMNTALNGLGFLATPNVSGAASLTITTNDLGNTGSGGAKSDTDVVAITVAGFVVSPTGGLTTGEDLDTDTFSVVLRSAPTADVTIPITSSNTSEGTVSTASLVFTMANWNIAQIVTVTGVDDFVIDGDVAYSVITGAAVSADTNYNGLDPVDVNAVNVDNDTPGVRVSPTTGLTTTEAGGTATFEVELNSQPQPGTTVTISITSSNPAEGTVSVSSLTFNDTNWNVPQTVTITGVNDFVADGDVGYTIITGNATGTDIDYNGLAVANVSVTNLDDDVVGFAVTPTSGLTTTEAGGQATFTVQLTSQPGADVTFSIVSSATGEGTVDTIELTFTAANWNDPQTVTITGVQDFINDGDTPYAILTGAGTSGDLAYNGLLVDDVSVTNLQVGNVAPVNSVPPGQTMVEDTALVFSGGTRISVADADAGNNALQVTLSVDQGNLTLSGTTGLVFGSGANGSASMGFTGTLSAINAALDGLRFDPFANFNGTATLQIVTNDLGNTGTGGAQVDTDTVAITVTPVNDAPVGTSKTVTLAEDTTHTFSAADFGFTDPQDAVGASGANSLLEVKITTLPLLGELRLDGNLFNAGDFVTKIDIDAGKLVFTPVANAFGLPYTSFDFQVRDDGSTPGVDLDPTPRTLTLNVTPVNDAPVITDGPDAVGLTETDAGLVASGLLTVSDVDTTDVVTASVFGLVVTGTSSRVDTAAPDDASLLAMLSLTPTTILSNTQSSATLTWSFNSGGEAFNYLAHGETLILTYTVKATDNGVGTLSDTETVTIVITGSNDQPTLTITDALGEMTAGNGAAILSDSGVLSFADLDTNDVVVVSQTSNNDIVWNGGTLTAGQMAALVAGFSVDQDSWDYTTTENLDFLRAGETITFSYNVVATDDSGAGNAASSAQVVTIVITGSNDQPTLTITDALGEMTEGDGAAALSDSGVLSFADLNTNDVVTVSQTSNNDMVWSGGTLSAGQIAALVAGFNVDQDSWDYATSQNLDFLRAGETITFSYNVVATDDSGAGNAASSAQVVTIVITGSNDQPTLTITDALGEMTEGDGAAALSDSGVLSFADLNTNDVVTVSQSSNNDMVWSGGTLTAGQMAALVAGFSVDQDSWDYTTTENLDFLRAGETITFSYNVVATDDSGAGNAVSSAQVVTIVITGSNDQPTLTITDALGEMTEGDGAAALSDSGVLSFADLNTNDVVTVSQTSNNDMVWSGGTLSSGQIAALVAGFNVDQDSWDYATSQNLDFLRAGETITFSYNVVATDDSGAGNAASSAQVVTIVITGSNDQPTLTITDALGEMTEGDGAAALSDSGVLSFADLNTNDVVTVSQSSNNDMVWSGGTLTAGQMAALVAGFSVDQDSWDYTTTENLDFLRAGETITFSYNVVATDDSGAGNAVSSAQVVTIVITGSNDQPTLTITDALGEMTEGDGAAALSDSGVLSFADLNTNDVVTVSQTSNNDIVWSGGTLSAGQITALVAGFSVSQNSWDYATSENLDFMRAGETITFSYNVVATDDSGAGNAASSVQVVTITITGSNDAPDITGAQVSASLSETNTTITASGTLNVVDADLLDTVTLGVDSVAINGSSTFAGTNPPDNADLLAMLSVTGGPLTADPTAGSDFTWTFTSGVSGNGAFDFLRQGETLVLNYTIKATDNSGAVNDSDTQVVTITITGSNAAPDITGAQVSASLIETNTTITANGRLNVVDANLADTVTMSVDSVAVDAASTFSLVNLLDIAALQTMMAVTTGALGADPSGGTDFTWTFTSGADGNSAFNFLREGETLVLNYTLKATDDAGTPLSDTQVVTITITGSNDQPTLTITDTLGAVTAGNGAATLSDSGTLSFADLDTNDVVTVSHTPNNDMVWSGGTLTAGQITALVAGFSVDQNSWDYTTSQNLDFLRAGETITFTYNVVATDNSGAGNAASNAQTVTIVITGSNNQPTLAIADTLGAMTEGNGTATLSASRALSFADLDTNDMVTVSHTPNNDTVWSGGTLGTGQIAALLAGFSVDQDSWDYTTSQNLDFLRAGETITFTYDVVATDNSGAGNAASVAQTVTIVITGSNDRPTLTIADRLGEMTEGNGAAILSDSGALSFADLDTNDVVTVSHTPNNDIVWSGGTLSAGQIAALVAGFSVDQNSWNYTTSQDLDFMRAGETITFTYTVVATDNSGAGNAASIPQTVTIVITGSNEAPVLATDTVTMSAQLEDAGLPAGPVGTRVSSLVSATGAGANVSDLDVGARLGIAITAANSDNGTWWYSMDDGGSWSALGAVSDASARLLAADATARLYFQPNPDWNGTLSSALLFRAWDQTSGGVGGLANTSAAGGRSAFSSAAASAALTITSVNDAPRASDAQVGVQTGSSYVFSVADFRFSDPRDTPSNQLAGVFIQGLPQAGRLSVAGVAVVAGQRVSAPDIAAGRLVYTPALNAAHGSVDSIAFRVQDSDGTANGGVDLDPDTRALRVAVSVPFVPVVETVVVAAPAPAPVPAAAPERAVERSASAPVAETVEELEEAVPVDLMEQAPKVGSARDIFASIPGGQNQPVLVATGTVNTASPVIAALADSTVTELLEIMRLAFQRSASATGGGGEGGDGSLSSPVPGLVIGQVQAPAAEQDEQQSTRFGLSPQVAASVTGVLVSAGFVSWALRAGSLLTTLLISVPAWRSVDPLPILAPEEDKPSWATDKEQEREEAAMAGLWSAGTENDADGMAR